MRKTLCYNEFSGAIWPSVNNALSDRTQSDGRLVLSPYEHHKQHPRYCFASLYLRRVGRLTSSLHDSLVEPFVTGALGKLNPNHMTVRIDGHFCSQGPGSEFEFLRRSPVDWREANNSR